MCPRPGGQSNYSILEDLTYVAILALILQAIYFIPNLKQMGSSVEVIACWPEVFQWTELVLDEMFVTKLEK